MPHYFLLPSTYSAPLFLLNFGDASSLRKSAFMNDLLLNYLGEGAIDVVAVVFISDPSISVITDIIESKNESQ